MAESHAAQNDAPAAEKVPRAHSTHPADPVKPAEVPLGHSEQRLLPARLENLPTEQAVQPALPVASEAKPTVQFVHNDAAVPENLPGAQSEQFTARPELKLPASHAEQVVAFSRLSVLKPAAQSRHAPVSATGAYFPAGQLLQLTVDAFTNWPAPHVSQENRVGSTVRSTTASLVGDPASAPAAPAPALSSFRASRSLVVAACGD